jgi:Ca2+-transporting ATPase
VLMRKIAAVETLGSASIICTDKTGTLTEGKMTLVKMHSGGADYVVGGKGFDPTVGKITFAEGGAEANAELGVRATLGSAILCSNTTLSQEVDEKDGLTKWTPKGNSSEAPLVVAAQKIGLKLGELEQYLKRVYEIPFSSSRKMMVTITQTEKPCELKHVAEAGGYTAHVKGAPNYIMEKCDKYMDKDGTIKPLTQEVKDGFMGKVDELSEQALRVLAIASCNFSELPFDAEAETDEKFAKIVGGLTFCGMCASIDPERDGVKEAVLDSKTAGVRVVMITGDYLKTAIAIAKNINILNRKTFVEGNGEATDCGALRPVREGVYLPDAEFDKMTATTSVFARAKPEDKLEIVKSLQRQGWVCAMTGDGVNDAPALQRADIGVAMGLEGTEVAKGASDMILTDDNFCSIVKAIEKGRIIYAGIQKFVSFIMSVHFAEVLQIFLCIVSSVPVMRQPLQILFLILVTDLPPSIALGFEPGEALTMKRKPRPKTQPVVLMWMWRGIVANGVILTICIFSTYMLCLWAYAGAFTTDDITGPNRDKCAIWKHDDWAPTMKFDCGLWEPCSADVSNAMFHVNCTNWQQNPIHQDAFKAYDDEREYTDATLVVEQFREKGATGAIYSRNPDCALCIETSIRRARTAAFISLVWAEGFRAYCSRSFENGVWVDTFNNPSMNKAVAMAQVTLVLALFIPGLSDEVLGLYVYEIYGFGWFLAFVGAFSCLVFCELYKYVGSQFIVEAELADYHEDADGNVATSSGGTTRYHDV